jgi:transposase
MVWTAPYGISCARMRLLRYLTTEPSVNQIIRIGMDTSKHIFQLHGVDAAEQVGLRKRLGRQQIAAISPDCARRERAGTGARVICHAGGEYAQLQVELKAIEVKLRAWHRGNADSRRLAKIPGVGPIGATALVMKTPDPRAFPSGRHFAAWLGLTPKDHSTAGKTRLGKITRAGDERLRNILVAGATAVIQQAKHGRGHPSPWVVALLKRKPPKLAAVALANKIARIAWKLLATGESYDGARMPGASASAA